MVKKASLFQKLNTISSLYWQVYDYETIDLEEIKTLDKLEDELLDYMFEPLRRLSLRTIFKYIPLRGDSNNMLAKEMADMAAADIIVDMKSKGRPRITFWVPYLRNFIKIYRPDAPYSRLGLEEPNMIDKLDIDDAAVIKSEMIKSYYNADSDLIAQEKMNILVRKLKKRIRDPICLLDNVGKISTYGVLALLFSTGESIDFTRIRPKEIGHLLQVLKIDFDASIRQITACQGSIES